MASRRHRFLTSALCLMCDCLPDDSFTIYHATNATDIFTMVNRRLQAGLEYTAKYNLGYEVPFTSNCGPPGLPHPQGAGWCFKTISNQSRGSFAPMWEMAGAIYGSKAVPFVHELLVNSTHGPPTGPVDKHGKPTGPPTPYRCVQSDTAAESPFSPAPCQATCPHVLP